MVWAILAIVLSCVSLFVFWWLGIIGAIFGCIGIVTSNDNKIQLGLSIAGVVVGLLSSITMLLIVSLVG